MVERARLARLARRKRNLLGYRSDGINQRFRQLWRLTEPCLVEDTKLWKACQLVETWCWPRHKLIIHMVSHVHGLFRVYTICARDIPPLPGGQRVRAVVGLRGSHPPDAQARVAARNLLLQVQPVDSWGEPVAVPR